MNKTIYVCSGDAVYRNYVAKNVCEVEKDADIVLCESQGALFESLRKFEGVYIICDKLFLGLMLKPKLSFIRGFLNDEAKIMVTAWHAEEIFFGVRIKNLGFDGVISNIGKHDEFTEGIKTFLNTGAYFDKVTESEYLNRTLSTHSRYVGDISLEEIDAVLKVRCKGNAKSSDAASSDSTVYARIASFKKKLGIVTDEELDRIIQQIKNGGLF